MSEDLDYVRPRRTTSRRLTIDSENWISPKLRRAILTRVRDRREAVDRLERQQRRDDPDASTVLRWTGMCQRVRLAASRAELAEWQAILAELGRAPRP